MDLAGDLEVSVAVAAKLLGAVLVGLIWGLRGLEAGPKTLKKIKNH